MLPDQKAAPKEPVGLGWLGTGEERKGCGWTKGCQPTGEPQCFLYGLVLHRCSPDPHSQLSHCNGSETKFSVPTAHQHNAHLTRGCKVL